MFIRAVMASVASLAIAPLQDVLGLGSEARMNLPGTVAGNWRWRFQPHHLTQEISQRLQTLTVLYERAGKVAELTPQGGGSPSPAFEA